MTMEAYKALPGHDPVSAHLKPSMTPTIGFRPYTQRQRSGTMELG